MKTATTWITTAVLLAFEGAIPAAAVGQAVPRFDQRDRAASLAREESFVRPQAFLPGQTGTKSTLDVEYAENSLDGVRLRHRSYNGGLVGPVIRVRPGSSLEIVMENNLPKESAGVGTTGNDTPHGFDTTNLHTHGLHVSPSDPADNVFRELGPGERRTFRYDIRPDHPAGTYWYHAHKHGSVALQLASGMAGALIVEGGLDLAPGVREADDKVLVFQQFAYRTIPGQPAIVHPDDVYSGFTPSPDAHYVTTVNGQVTPTIVMRPGEVQRWRLVHAGIEDVINLSLEGVKLHEIAVDGLATGTRVEKDSVELYPGYRSDILVKAPALAASDASRVVLLKTEVRDAKRSIRQQIRVAQNLIKVVVAGPPKEMPLPDPASLAGYAAFGDKDVPATAEIAKKRELRFALGDHQFFVNGAAFDPSRVDQTIRLGTAEEWKIVADAGGHPFHIHVNPFAVLQPADSSGKERWLWRDTLFVPDSETATIRSRFVDFTGKTVLHCHILDHEDQGMMQAVEIVPDGNAAVPRVLPGRGLAALPATAPAWAVSAPGAGGRHVQSSDYLGRPALVVLHRGLGCAHCADQVGLLAKHRTAIELAGLDVVAISPELPDGDNLRVIREEKGITFPLLADPGLGVFRAYGCLDPAGDALHGVYVVNATGKVVWQTVGEEPELDINRLVEQARRALDARP